jgi:hypothetical protein
MELVFLTCGGEDAENAAAHAWALAHGWTVRSLPTTAAGAGPIAGAGAFWCHAGHGVPRLSGAVRDALAHVLQAGARGVLTLLAAPLAAELGAPGDGPRVELPRAWKHDEDPRWPRGFRDWPDYPHVRGFQAWGDHPLFAGMQRGTFTWMAREGDRPARAAFARPHWPAGHVIAVDRSYVHLDADTAVAWEYDMGAGRLVCLGANIHFLSGDPVLAPQRDAVLANVLADAVATPGGVVRRAAWPGADRRHAPVAPNPRPRPIAAPGGAVDLPGALAIATPGDEPVTLGTRRGLIIGSAGAGVAELWLHPLCVVSGGIHVTCDAGELRAERSTVSPAHAERHLAATGGGTWREVVTGAASEPEIHYALEPTSAGAADATVAIELAMPLRLEWPFPPDALAPLRSENRRAGSRATVVVTGCDGEHALALFADGVAELQLRDDDAAPSLRLFSEPGQGLRIAFRASAEGARGLALVTAGMAPALAEQGRRLDELHARGVRLTSGAGDLDAAWSRALARLANFVASAPPTGDGLMAGYAASRGGWNVSRPGYAWFFGRDTCWTVDALLAGGLFEEARVGIDLLARTADVTGKVVHELTTSGVAHYDAADSTPLFLRAVAAFGEWTGDRDSLRRWWPAVERAFHCVVACDRDADGLPENTGIGHGWIEMGPLGGGAVTSYVAAIWLDALRRLGPVAAALGEDVFVERLAFALRRAEEGVERLRLPEGRLALHRDRAGLLCPDRTAMAAVPIALGIEHGPVARETAEALSRPEFSTPWGLRMLPSDDPRYDPTGYHAGSVWPLFTGWAALADSRVGSVDRAFERVVSIATHATAKGTGGFAEVLHGDTGARAGVCPDQAWSAAMLVAPLVTGVAGLRPDALAARCTFGTKLPRAVDRLELDNVRIGESRLSCRWRRTGAGVVLEVEHGGGAPLDIGAGEAHPATRRIGPGETAAFAVPDENPWSPSD